MNDRRLMTVQVLERVKQLVRPAEYLITGEGLAAAGEDLTEVRAFDELHDHVLTCALIEMVKHTW
jgi:hypothetical protein